MFRLRLALRLGVPPGRLGDMLTAEEYHQFAALDHLDNAPPDAHPDADFND